MMNQLTLLVPSMAIYGPLYLLAVQIYPGQIYRTNFERVGCNLRASPRKICSSFHESDLPPQIQLHKPNNACGTPLGLSEDNVNRCTIQVWAQINIIHSKRSSLNKLNYPVAIYPLVHGRIHFDGTSLRNKINGKACRPQVLCPSPQQRI